MLLGYLISVIIFLAGGLVGHLPAIRIDKLDKSRVLNTALAAALFFTLLMIAYLTGYFPHTVAAPFMMSVYSFIAGFFTGYGIRLIQLRKQAGYILYMHRSFWVDHAPGLAAVVIIIYGIYRTSLLLEQPVTGIRLTSGLSLMAIGFFGLTLKIVPEFRTSGILFLDNLISWKQVLAWRWHSEDIVRIEYMYDPGLPDEEVRELLTTIPPEERKQIETVLQSKMDDAIEEREKMLGIRNT
jgi:hypothetical protein